MSPMIEALPSSGSTAWYPHYSELDSRVRSGLQLARVVATVNSPDWAKAAAHYVGDGTADQVEINAAEADLPAGGGQILLAPGDFNLSAPVVFSKHGTLVSGCGTGARSDASQASVGTRLKAVSGFTGTAVVRVAGGTAPLHGVTLRDFTIDGGGIGSGIDGLHFRSHTGMVDHVHVHRATGNGINVQGYTAGSEGASVSWATYETVLRGLAVSNCTAAGLWINSRAQDMHVLNSTFYYNGDNIRINAGSQQFTDVHTYSGTRYNVWFDGSGSRTKIVNLKCEQAGQHGVFLDGTTTGGSDVSVTGSNFKNNGHTADATYDHIHIGGGAAAWSRSMFAALNFSVAADTTGDSYDLNRARSAVYLGSNSRNTVVGPIAVGDGHVRTANVIDSGPTLVATRNVVGVGTGLSYVTNPDGTRTYFGGASQPSGIQSGDYWQHDAV